MLTSVESSRGQQPAAAATSRTLVPITTTGDDQEIRAELDSILASEFFRGSKRCQSFFKFVVEAVMSESAHQLKERTLGIELFRRSPAYDTNEDAIVRVTANDVRRRLAQYSVFADPERAIRIELAPGSYVPRFHRSIPVEPAPPTALPRRGRIRLTVLAAVVTLAVAGAFANVYSSDPLRQFWGPLLTSQATPIVCIGNPQVYVRDSPQPSERSNQVSRGSGAQLAALKPSGDYERSPHPYVSFAPNSFVGIGDSSASFLIGRELQSLGRPSHARLSDLVSFSDLKGSPAVLIGAFSNRWTMLMTGNFRFSFAKHDHTPTIVDRDHPSRVWTVPSLQRTGLAREDYAIVARIPNAPSGQSVVIVAGISGWGSQAAGEFVTNKRALQTLMRQAPRDWERMNMEAVLRTTVVNDTTTPAEVVAVYFW